MNPQMTRKRLGERRVSRRWMLGAMGATASAAGLAALRCSDGDNVPPGFTPSETDDETPQPGANPTPRVQDGRRGQTLRHTGFVVRDSTFDPHKTQASPYYGH